MKIFKKEKSSKISKNRRAITVEKYLPIRTFSERFFEDVPEELKLDPIKARNHRNLGLSNFGEISDSSQSLEIGGVGKSSSEEAHP